MAYYLSPSYFFIKDLNKEKNPLIGGYPIYKKRVEDEDRKYWVIELKFDQNQSLFDNYRLDESHFCFDKFYDPKMEEHGLTAIHFTQTYVSLVDNTKRIVHGYLNAKGQYQYSKVKQIPKSDTSIILTPDQENKLKASFEEHKPLLEALLEEKNDRRKKAAQEADTLDRELMDLSRTVNNKRSRSQYLSIAQEFIKAVHKFNRYSEFTEKDSRYKIIFRMLKNIEAIQLCGQVEIKSEIVVEPEVLEVEELSLLPQKDSIHELYQLVIRKITEKSEAFKKTASMDLESVILKNKLVEELNEQILIFYSFNPQLVKNQDLERIEAILVKMNAFYRKQNNLLKQYVIKRDLENFKLFFPEIKKFLTQDFYYDLISMLVEGKNVLEICEYLNDNDNQYRESVRKLSDDKNYDFIKDEAFYLAMKGSRIKEYESTLLFKVYCEDNLLLFKTLLHHGANPESGGYKEKGQECPITLFYTIGKIGAFKKPKNYLEFLKVLLEYNVDPNKIYRKSIYIEAARKKISDFKESKKLQSQDERVFYIEHISFMPIFALIVNFTREVDLKAMELILPHTSVANLGWALASMFGNCIYLSKTFVLNDSPIIYTTLNREEIIPIIDKFREKEADPNAYPSSQDLFVGCLFYLKLNTTLEQEILGITALTEINWLNRTLSEKITHLTLEEFEKEYNELLEISNQYMLHSAWSEAFDTLVGCEFILIRRYCLTKGVNEAEAKLLLQKYLKALYEKLNIVMFKTYPGDYAYPFMDIRMKSLFSLTQQFLSKGGEFNEVFDTILSICFATKKSDIQRLNQLLLEVSEDKLLLDETHPTCKGWTPLHFACKVGNDTKDFRCAEALIKAGASIHVWNVKGKKPLSLIKNKPTIVANLKDLYEKKKLGL